VQNTAINSKNWFFIIGFKGMIMRFYKKAGDYKYWLAAKLTKFLE
jgi:hypothetical protein